MGNEPILWQGYGLLSVPLGLFVKWLVLVCLRFCALVGYSSGRVCVFFSVLYLWEFYCGIFFLSSDLGVLVCLQVHWYSQSALCVIFFFHSLYLILVLKAKSLALHNLKRRFGNTFTKYCSRHRRPAPHSRFLRSLQLLRTQKTSLCLCHQHFKTQFRERLGIDSVISVVGRLKFVDIVRVFSSQQMVLWPSITRGYIFEIVP